MPKNTSQELDSQFKNAIDNYGSQIKTLKDHVEAVRQNVGMWLSGIGNRAFLSMQREVFQNSVDQILLPESPANFVYFYYNENTLETIVEDNGLGFPFEDIERIITTPNTSKNYEKKKFQMSCGLHGVGLKASNAVTLDLVAESYRYDGTAVRFKTHQGYPVKSKNKPNPEPIPNKSKKQGSRIWFVPDQSVLGELDVKWEEIYTLIKNIIIRTPIGTECRFEAVDKNGIVHKEDIINKDGIITNLIEMSHKPICKPISIQDNDGWMMLNTAFIFDGGENPTGLVRATSYCNMCPTIAGTHTDGTIDGICKWFTKYMNDIFISSTKGKTKVIAADIKSNIVVSIAAAMVEPVFIGQAKEQLANKEMAPFCRDTVLKGLDDWAKANPNELLKICKYLKEVAEIRAKNDKVKETIVNKFQANSITGYPSKFSRPVKENKEFIIVEGDSAGGSVKEGRDRNTQGVFPIRGKLPNSFRTSKSKMFENTEIQGIIKCILRGPYRKDFDPIKDVEWDKIILMADADVDGSHISVLVSSFFLMYMPQIIQAGKLYRAVPPLYSIPKGKNGDTYFTENIDFVNYLQKEFMKTNTIVKVDGKPVASKDLLYFFNLNQDYVYYLDSVSQTCAVDPEILEIALFNYYNKTSMAALKKDIKSKYRFMDVTKQNNTTIIRGTTTEANILFMNDYTIKLSSNILRLLEKNKEFYYKFNGTVSSIYRIMKAFEKTQPNRLQRYKGLGEMDAEQIAISTLRPDSNRFLIRYTIDDIKNEIAAIDKYNDNFNQLFKFVGEVSRQELLD